MGKICINDTEYTSMGIGGEGMGKIIRNDIVYAGGLGGSSMHEYSTTEHEVGKWIDGSTVYERTFVSTNALATGDNIIGNIPNFKELVKVDTVIRNSIATLWSDYKGTQANENFYTLVNVETGDVIIEAKAGWGSPKIHCTIRYTKTEQGV